MAVLKQLSTRENSYGIEIKRPNTQHPNAKAFMLAQVTPDESIIVSLAESEFASEMYVIDSTKDIPEHFPTEVKTRIQLWLQENKFDERDNDVCIISPFIPNLRGFIVEIFDRDYAEHYAREIAKNSRIRVKGLVTVLEDAVLDEYEVTNVDDPELNQKIQELKHKEEIENQQAVEKARIINRRLW